MAAPVVPAALVNVPAGHPVPREAVPTVAFVGTRGVDAFGVLVAVRHGQLAFVVVRASLSVFLHRVAKVAPTGEGSFGVLASAVHAQVGVQETLVNVDAILPVRRRDEAIPAVTSVRTRHIGAFSSPADTRVLRAFLHVFATKSVRGQFVSFLTNAVVTSWGVDTLVLAPSVVAVDGALVHVFATGLLRQRRREPFVATTPEGAHHVFAHSV